MRRLDRLRVKWLGQHGGMKKWSLVCTFVLLLGLICITRVRGWLRFVLHIVNIWCELVWKSG